MGLFIHGVSIALIKLPFIHMWIVVYDDLTNFRRFIMHSKRWSPCQER